MNQEQFERMKNGKGFIAALDQSGGSTPKALKGYGIDESAYSNDEEMFGLIHQMRTRVITSKSFNSDSILGAILFQRTMNSEIEGKPTADYLWDVKGVVPFLKVDLGLADEEDDVKLMKPITNLDETLKSANEHHIFGTKMRSVINAANPEGIKKIVDQQFDYGLQIWNAGLVPILEPEVTITIPDKAEAEDILKAEIKKHLATLDDDVRIMLKISIPTKEAFYSDIMEDPHMVRVVALSGGYSTEEANELLKKQPGLIASFSRALLGDLRAQQSQEEFDDILAKTIKGIYEASIA